MVKNSPASTGDTGDLGSIPGSRRGNGNPLQYFCLENLMDRGVWWARVHRVAKSQTRLKQLSTQAELPTERKNDHWASETTDDFSMGPLDLWV